MQYDDLVRLLMEAKRRAQQQGRPASPNEMRGVAGGWFDTAANRALQGRQLDLQEKGINFQEKHGADELAIEQWRTLAMLKAAQKSNRNQMWQNLIKGGVTLGALGYMDRG